jgi:PAS domain S-box-containing protein
MKFTPLRITLIYFAFAVVWITTTDAILEWLVSDVQMLTQLQTIKGLFYITITAVALFFMMKSYEKHISKNESKLKEQEQSLNLALDSAAMATWKYFAEGDYYITSEKHHQLFGYDKSHDLSLPDVLERVHPDDIESFMAGARKTLDDGTEFNQKYRVVIPGKKIVWLWTRGKAQFEAGIVRTVSGVTIDITENKELEMQLEIERERLEKLFERIPILINVYDGDENLISINKYYEDVLGWTEEDIKDASMLELCYPDPKYREEVRKDIKSLNKGWKEYRVRSKSEEVRDQLWTNIMLSDNTFVGIGYDITERKQLEGQLMKEREELEKIFDNMPVFINIHDQESGIASANKYFEERMGYSSDFIRNHDLIATMTQSSEKNQVIEAIEESDGKWRDFELTTANGETLQTTWVNIKISRNKSLGIGLDITERKKMEEELRDKEESLRLITVSSNVGLWEWWPKTGKTKFDEIWAELVGYKLEELEPVSIKTWDRLLHPDDHEKFEAAVEEYYAGKSSAYECEVRMKHKDGYWVWILDRGRAVEWDENGDVIKMVGTHIDITDRKRYEQENQLLANVFTRSNTPLSVSNHNSNKLERVNEAYVNLLGYSEQELVGMKVEDLYPKESVRYVKEQVEELDKKGFVSFNTQLKKSDGSLFDAIVNLSLIRDEKFQDAYRISTVQDISELKEVQRELANERNRFELIAKSSNDVLYEMDIQNRRVWWSEGWTSSFGYKQEEVSEDFSWWDERLHPDDHDRVFENYLNALNTDREYWSDKYRFKDAEGNYRWVLDKGFFVTNRKGEKTFLVGTISDITPMSWQKRSLNDRRSSTGCCLNRARCQCISTTRKAITLFR